jgi:predicted dehydrogenase/aryl-alcohol dehydrogenase-like predicted oxidoreductase
MTNASPASPASPVRFGIVSTGAIAKTMAKALHNAPSTTPAAVASRTLESAKAFAEAHDIPHAFGSADEMLASDAIDAVYIATPHIAHAKWAIRAAEAGKHVFLEKPAGLNRPQVEAIIEAAVANGVLFAEAFKERRHPQTHRLLDLLGEQAIGQVQIIRCHFGFPAGFDPDHRLFNPDLAGGGIMDVGCYPVAMARLLAAASMPDCEAHFAHPAEVQGVAKLAPTGVDQAASAVLAFENGPIAELSTGVHTPGNVGLTIIGKDGRIVVPNPWANDRSSGGTFTIEVYRQGKDAETITLDEAMTAFALEAEAMAQDILAGRTEASAPGFTHADSLSQAMVLDAWRKAVKVEFPDETPARFTRPLHGDPLRKAADTGMAFGQVPGLDKPVSRFVMGCDNQMTFSHGAVIWDAWYEAGGNAFDTAWVYCGGTIEARLGHWFATRGVRDECTLIVKGGHTPECHPEAIDRQLDQSLERLQTDYADIYIMHRDNPDIPVGEFVDCLDAHARAGRITVFGGSNWSLERLKAANEYAKANDKQGFGVLSNNFSLARMLEPVWAGCISSSDPESVAVLTERQIANFAWSSQARGWFVKPDGDALSTGVNSWDSPDNRERRRRAFELADDLGVTAINVAAAYVLNQPFPSFALIGPRRLSELRTSLPALSIELTPEQLAWLDLRCDTKP